MTVRMFVAACLIATCAGGPPAWALEDGAAECPVSWEFEGRPLPLWYSALHAGSIRQVHEMEPTWATGNERWIVVDLRNEETGRPAYLLCTYRLHKGPIHQIVVGLPDSVSNCILRGGDDGVFDRRCVWPLADGKPELSVTGRVTADIDVEGLAVRRGEKELEAIVVSQGGSWSLREDQGETVADVVFPASAGKATVRFSARSGMAREVFLERPVSPDSTLLFKIVKRFGYLTLPVCESPCFHVWQSDPDFRIEYGGNWYGTGAEDNLTDYFRLLDLTDPASIPAP